MRLVPLATNEIADNGGYNYIAAVSYLDLTTTANNTAQTIKLCDIRAGDTILKVAFRVKTFFKNSADTAFNTTTMSIGDSGGVADIITAKELNANGTTVTQGLSNTAVSYTAADALNATFNAMSAKNLNAINTGEVEILFQLSRISTLERATSAANSNTRSLTFGTGKI